VGTSFRVTSRPRLVSIFMASFNATLDRYGGLLSAQQADRLELPNQNFDVGEPTGARRYKLMMALMRTCWTSWRAAILTCLRTYGSIFRYGDLSAPVPTDAREWAKVIREIDELRAVSPGALVLQ
jgi:hypothetical protein